MKKIIGIIVIILMIPVIISIIGDIDRTPIYPTTEYNIIDKSIDKQLLTNDKLLYELPNTINDTINELPQYVEYYEYGILEVDSGILNYTVNDNLAYLNYIEGELTQVVDDELIISKPTQIISKSSNLFDKYNYIDLVGWEITETGFIRPAGNSERLEFVIPTIVNKAYTLSFNIENSGRISIIDIESNTIIVPLTIETTITFVAIGNNTRIRFDTRSIDTGTMTEWSNVRLNEGTVALPYEPFGEHIYNLGNDVELYKLPNGVGDRWLQNGTLERKVGIIDTVNNYAEFGTLTTGTYDNILEFIDNNQNKQIKLFFNDNIQESRYNTYLENDTIIINNDSEVIRIYSNDTYTSTLNLDTDITYKLEGYNILEYIDGKFDNTVLAFFWILPVLLVGGLIYLLLKRKE